MVCRAVRSQVLRSALLSSSSSSSSLSSFACVSSTAVKHEVHQCDERRVRAPVISSISFNFTIFIMIYVSVQVASKTKRVRIRLTIMVTSTSDQTISSGSRADRLERSCRTVAPKTVPIVTTDRARALVTSSCMRSVFQQADVTGHVIVTERAVNTVAHRAIMAVSDI